MNFEWSTVAKSPAQIKRYLAVALAQYRNRPGVELHDRSTFRDLNFTEVSYVEGTGADHVYVITIKNNHPFLNRQEVFKLTKDVFELPPHPEAEERLMNDDNWAPGVLRVAVPAKTKRRPGSPDLLNVRRIIEV